MSVYKRYKGKRISSSRPRYADARWWIYKRLKGKTIHQSVPEAKTKQEAELAERQIIKASFDHSYNVADTTTTLASLIETKYRAYVEQNNVNKGAKELYIRLLLKHFKKQTIGSITPQDFVAIVERSCKIDRTKERRKAHYHRHRSIASCRPCRRSSASHARKESSSGTRCST